MRRRSNATRLKKTCIKSSTQCCLQIRVVKWTTTAPNGRQNHARIEAGQPASEHRHQTACSDVRLCCLPWC